MSSILNRLRGAGLTAQQARHLTSQLPAGDSRTLLEKRLNGASAREAAEAAGIDPSRFDQAESEAVQQLKQLAPPQPSGWGRTDFNVLATAWEIHQSRPDLQVIEVQSELGPQIFDRNYLGYLIEYAAGRHPEFKRAIEQIERRLKGKDQ